MQEDSDIASESSPGDWLYGESISRFGRRRAKALGRAKLHDDDNGDDSSCLGLPRRDEMIASLGTERVGHRYSGGRLRVRDSPRSMKDSGCTVNAESRREGPLLVGPSDFRTENLISCRRTTLILLHLQPADNASFSA